MREKIIDDLIEAWKTTKSGTMKEAISRDIILWRYPELGSKIGNMARRQVYAISDSIIKKRVAESMQTSVVMDTETEKVMRIKI